MTLHQDTDTWWKALCVFNEFGKFLHEDLWVQDDHHSDSGLMDYKELKEDKIVLSKAKFLGIHTNMYWVQNASEFTPEFDWDINWKKDNPGN